MMLVNLNDKRKLITLQILLFCLTLVFVSMQSAHALTVLPDLVNATSPSAGQTSGTSNPWHTMILSDHGKVPKIDLGIYFNDNASNKTFQTSVSGGPGDCNTRAADGYDRTHTYVVVELNGVPIRNFTGREVCNGTFNGYTYTIPAGSLQLNYRGTGVKTYGATLQIRWVNDSEAAAQLGIGATRCNNINVCPIRPNISKQGSGAGSNVRFRVSATSPGGRIGYINTDSSSLNSPNNSIIHGVTTPNGYEKIFYPFALPCTATTNVSNAMVTLYDADNGTSAQNLALQFYVATIDENTHVVTPLRAGEYYGNGGGAATSLGDIWVNEDPSGSRNPPSANLRSNPDGYPVFTPSNFNNNGGLTQVRILTFNKDKKYVLVAEQVHANQFIYVGLPGDAIFGSPDFHCPGAEITPNAVLTNTSDPSMTTFIEPGQQFNGTGSFNNAAAIAGSVSAYLVVWLDGGDQDINIASPLLGGDNIVGLTPLGPRTVNVPASASGTPLGVSRTGTADQTHEFVCSRVYSVTPTPPATVTRDKDTKCIRIERRPFFQAIGGDINSAAVFPDATSGNCGSVPAGKGLIAGWNKGTGTYTGAGTNIAAFAAQAITDFASYRPGVPPKGLAFAGGGAYGGGFDETYCIDKVTAYDAGDKFVTPNSGADTFNGSITTTGNIYVSSQVTTINGIFITKKNIYTCATGVGSPVSASQMKSLCNTTLTINGAFVADIVYLLRTNGGLSSGTPAEVFNYGPGAWLPSILPPSGGGPGSINLGPADSETSLPPVL